MTFSPRPARAIPSDNGHPIPSNSAVKPSLALPKRIDYEDYHAQPSARCVLNVAGSRASKGHGIEQMVFKVSVDMLIKVNPDSRVVYPPI